MDMEYLGLRGDVTGVCRFEDDRITLERNEVACVSPFSPIVQPSRPEGTEKNPWKYWYMGKQAREEKGRRGEGTTFGIGERGRT